ncbi:ATP phosphoribosyltransferase regulatory subunit [Leptospira idonii]|uniref:ATP phosphoribosyltransferase regulatory subunit n=1 Tax=Leptospira idonii TaxID=1193500 RepID=A0A4V3JXT2_9LEPT|nr:ATP phosphoribosyltransferase regulatory subunit [Leptospira idonii]TGN18376.1 ATP phosphoribosyltransferase regulatory subunit [Leptospira idonii]
MNSAKKSKLAERRWIPDGFHFLGPEESRNRRNLLQGLTQIFEEHNYSEITLPSFDYTSSFQSQMEAGESSSLLRSKDWDGFELSPGVDLTLQVVKGMATRSHWEENQNVYYVGRKIRDHKKRNASRREILQIGGESIGNSHPSQIISQVLLLEKLWKYSCRETSVSFVLGHSGLISRVFELLGWTEEWEGTFRQLLFTKNSTELIGLAARKNTPPSLIQILKAFLKPVAFTEFSGFEKQIVSFLSELQKEWETSEFRKQTATKEDVRNQIDSVKQSLGEVRSFIETWEKGNVHFTGIWDPALIRDVNYYTGIVFQGYMNAYPEPVFAGGVYNSLYETYTEIKKDACGFALHIDPIEEIFNIKK